MFHSVLLLNQKQGDLLQCSVTGPEAGRCLTVFWYRTKSRVMSCSVLVLDQKQGDVSQRSGTGPEAG